MLNLKKPCKWCGKDNHLAWHCIQNPKRQAQKIKKVGKQAMRWANTRREWFEQNPQELYSCFYCGRSLTRSQVTLDHYHSRSRHPELRHELSNLRVACWVCNGEKGSIDGDDFKKV
jgi:5-methylcytosine-specific restriction endonuclease McrA